MDSSLALGARFQTKNAVINEFLKQSGFKDGEISVSVSAIIDRGPRQ